MRTKIASPARPKALAAEGKRPGRNGANGHRPLKLRLYVAGQTPKSMAALANLRDACEEFLPGKYRIQVVDLSKNPQLARGDQILALPTVVRHLPPPLRRMIGDLSDRQKLLIGLDIKPA